MSDEGSMKPSQIRDGSDGQSLRTENGIAVWSDKTEIESRTSDPSVDSSDVGRIWVRSDL